MLFALSFFGLFEIRLPGGLANKAGAKSGLASVGGIFFMVLTLVIVSFSCTGVILGVLLAGVAASGPWALSAGMGGFGLALALPFALFAIFPHGLKSLPKSGGWMERVKVSLAFVELALAFKFLSNADLVEHWGILKREVFIGIWLLIALGLAGYLLGLFPRQKKYEGMRNADAAPPKVRRPWVWWTLGGLILLFALYLIPGLTSHSQANLKLLSGFAPPLSYSVYGKGNVHGKGVEPNVVNDFDSAVALAKLQGKPLLVDFTGWACMNCRKMEEQIWVQPAVKEVIQNEFVLVSLYVDDRKGLAEGSKTVTTASGDVKRVNTVGDQWALFQAENFGQVTQPLYVLLSPYGKLLNNPVGYTPSVASYEEWLRCGLAAYAELQKSRR